jgi:hypothetical protein
MADAATAEPPLATDTGAVNLHDDEDIETENHTTTLETPGDHLATSTAHHEDEVDGDGSAGGDSAALAPTKKIKKIIRKKRRPARAQADPSILKSEPPPQTGTIFNIWYNKWSGTPLP